MTFEIEQEDLSTAKFKAIINNSNRFSFFDNLSYLKNDFLTADPCENNFLNLIVADPNVLKAIKPGLIIKDISCQDISCQDTKYQVLKYKKYFLADKLYYISVFLTVA